MKLKLVNRLNKSLLFFVNGELCFCWVEEKKKGRGCQRDLWLCKASKQLDCIVLIQQVTWKIWVLKNGYFILMRVIHPLTSFARLLASKKQNKFLSTYFIGMVESMTRSMKVCPTRSVWVLYLEYINTIDVWLGMLPLMKEGVTTSVFSSVPFSFPRGLPLIRMFTYAIQLHLTSWPSFFLPRSQWGLDSNS